MKFLIVSSADDSLSKDVNCKLPLYFVFLKSSGTLGTEDFVKMEPRLN